MITEKPDTERMTLRMESIWMDAENRIIKDVIRRIRQYGEITSTADYQINRLIEMGRSREEVERIIKDSLGKTWPEMFELYDNAAEWQYIRNKDVYLAVNGEFIPPEDNESLKQISRAVAQQTQDELKNLSSSFGFSVVINGKQVFTPFADYYQKYVDDVLLDVLSGGIDYNTAMRRAVTQMTNSGLRFVDYASGHSDRAHVAIRRAVMTGLGQIANRINEETAQALGTDFYEVDWHAGARPDHMVWQGKVYSKSQLVSVCGLGEVTGLMGANCYHNYYPFVKGASVRQWSDDWLKQKNAEEMEPREWKGKDLTLYDVTQTQRKMERNMRAQRSKIVALKAGGETKEKIDEAKVKYQAQLYEYTVFCSKMGQQQQRERIYMDMLGRVA